MKTDVGISIEDEIRKLLAVIAPEKLIARIRKVRDDDRAAAKAELDKERAALAAKYKAAGVPVRTLGPRSPKQMTIAAEPDAASH